MDRLMQEADGISQGIGQLIRLGQMFLVPACGLIFMWGLILLFYAFKNPIRKRKAYLFSIFGGIGFLLFTYLPLLLTYFVFAKPKSAPANATAEKLVDGFSPLYQKIYDFGIVLAEPFIVFLFYMGVFFWLMAAKNPQIKRMGIGLIVGTPVLWIVIQRGMDIYHFFV